MSYDKEIKLSFQLLRILRKLSFAFFSLIKKKLALNTTIEYRLVTHSV